MKAGGNFTALHRRPVETFENLGPHHLGVIGTLEREAAQDQVKEGGPQGIDVGADIQPSLAPGLFGG